MHPVCCRYSGNNAWPTPTRLRTAMGNISLKTEVFIGGRADKNYDRHFHGRVAHVLVLTTAVGADEIRCAYLSDRPA